MEHRTPSTDSINSSNDSINVDQRLAFEKLLAVEVGKVAALEDENQRLRLELSKVAGLNLKDELDRLQEINKSLAEKLAAEVAKNNILETQVKLDPRASTPALNNSNGTNNNNKTKQTVPAIISLLVPAKVLEPEKGSNRTYTAYLIDVELENRRYKQFVLLHTQLVRIYGEHGLPHLPAKSNGLYFSSNDHTEKRRTGLQDYLQNLLKSQSIGQSVILFQFLKEEITATDVAQP
eukprot:gene2512-2870_t